MCQSTSTRKKKLHFAAAANRSIMRKNKLPAFAAVAPFARIAFHLAAEGDTKRPATARARMRFQSSHRVRDAAGPKCRAASRDAELISRSPQRSAARRCVALRCVALHCATLQNETGRQFNLHMRPMRPSTCPRGVIHPLRGRDAIDRRYRW
jgi:hypothetical protein